MNSLACIRGGFALVALTLLLGCGGERTDIVQVADDDPVMTKAIADARASVSDFIAVLESPQPGRQGMAVKVKFEEGDVSEHIWLSQVTHADGVFTGTIDNVPEGISSVAYGDRHEVPAEEVTDWMYLENGKLKGGYTIRALIELTPPDQRPQLPFDID